MKKQSGESRAGRSVGDDGAERRQCATEWGAVERKRKRQKGGEKKAETDGGRGRGNASGGGAATRCSPFLVAGRDMNGREKAEGAGGRRKARYKATAPVVAVSHCLHIVLGGLEPCRYGGDSAKAPEIRSEEHTSELQSLMRNSYAVFCLKKKTNTRHTIEIHD